MTEKTVLTLEDLYSDTVLAKGRKLLESGKVVQDADRPSVFEVRGSRPYTVTHIETTPDDEDGNPQDDQGLAWLACTCPNGSARGARPNCYHTAAVLLFIRDKWEEVREEVGGQSLADKVESKRSAIVERDLDALRMLRARKVRLDDREAGQLRLKVLFELRQTGEPLTEERLDRIIGRFRREGPTVGEDTKMRGHLDSLEVAAVAEEQRQVDELLDNRSPAQVEEDEVETLEIIVSSNRHGKVHAPALPAFDEVEHLAYPHKPGTLPGNFCAGCAETTNGETNG